MRFYQRTIDRERTALDAKDPERNGKDEKKAVPGLLPEPEEEQADHQIPHDDRAGNQLVHDLENSAHFVSHTSPLISTIRPASTGKLRIGDRSMVGTTSR